MYWNPIVNLASCIKSKPPLVVFTLCLFTFLITTVSLAFYVQYNDSIENRDAQDQWLSLLKYLSKNSFCIENSNSSDVKLNSSLKSDKVNISTYAIATLPTLNHSASIHSLVSLKDWSHPCLKENDKPENLELYFSVQPTGIMKDQSVCVVLSGPQEFMPKFDGEAECVIEDENEPLRKMTISNNVGLGTCYDGSFVKIEFDINTAKKIDSEEYLSLNDKKIINMHLITTSYFIVFVIVVVICCAMVKGIKGEQKQDTRHLLTGKVLHT